MECFDLHTPPTLLREQLWFGAIIGRPIDTENRMNPISPAGISMEVEAAEHILPSPTLRPAERIQIYNQQYWWRLLKAVQDIYPLLTRLFGYLDFNQQIAIPYLIAYPPLHWALGRIGDKLCDWLKESYFELDRVLVLEAAAIDSAFSKSFAAEEKVALTLENLESTIYLQPHLHLFAENYDIFHYREIFLSQDPDYWREHPCPPIERGELHHFILYRNLHHEIAWRKCSPSEYTLLKQFSKGMTLSKMTEWIEQQPKALSSEVEAHLEEWFCEWTKLKWLSS